MKDALCIFRSRLTGLWFDGGDRFGDGTPDKAKAMAIPLSWFLEEPNLAGFDYEPAPQEAIERFEALPVREPRP